MQSLKIAYVSLWFPLPSETFIFREVQNLRGVGLPIVVRTLYGPTSKRLSPEMRVASADVRTMGVRALFRICRDVAYWRGANPKAFAALWREVPWRRWSCLEVAGENLWAFLAGFHLARLVKREGVTHLHAPWANGPATAVWTASRLTGLPFSFAGRAGDIYPQDGALPEKIRAAAFVHTNNQANVPYLTSLAPECADKIFQVYNSLTLPERQEARAEMSPPYRLLAVGRFCRTKGFDVLLQACRVLEDREVPFQLTLVGSGFWNGKLRRLTRNLGLSGRVYLPGFVTHDRITELMTNHDVFVMPSVIHKSGDRDGIPNVIMEALTHRLPVVASEVSGIPEVVRHGETGLLVRQRDPEALADAVMDMVSDRDRALAMAERGRALVKAMFDPETNTRKLLGVFLDKAGRKAAPARSA